MQTLFQEIYQGVGYSPKPKQIKRGCGGPLVFVEFNHPFICCFISKTDLKFPNHSVCALLTGHRCRQPVRRAGCRWWRWRWQQWWCRGGWSSLGSSVHLVDRAVHYMFMQKIMRTHKHTHTHTGKDQRHTHTWHVGASHDSGAAIKHDGENSCKGHHSSGCVIHSVVSCGTREQTGNLQCAFLEFDLRGHVQ